MPSKTNTPPSAPGRYRWVSPVAVLIFLILVFCWLVFNVPVFNDYKQAAALRNQQRNSLRQLETEIVQLEEQKKQFELGESEKERVIRERYKMVKEGERLIQLIDKPEP